MHGILTINNKKGRRDAVQPANLVNHLLVDNSHVRFFPIFNLLYCVQHMMCWVVNSNSSKIEYHMDDSRLQGPLPVLKAD